MDGIVVQARNRQRDFREKINRVEDDGSEYEQRERGVFPTVGAVLRQAIRLRNFRGGNRVLGFSTRMASYHGPGFCARFLRRCADLYAKKGGPVGGRLTSGKNGK